MRRTNDATHTGQRAYYFREFAVSVEVIEGDALWVLPGLAGGSVQCCVTSPPYWGLRDYGPGGEAARPGRHTHRGEPEVLRDGAAALQHAGHRAAVQVRA